MIESQSEIKNLKVIFKAGLRILAFQRIEHRYPKVTFVANELLVRCAHNLREQKFKTCGVIAFTSISYFTLVIKGCFS